MTDRPPDDYVAQYLDHYTHRRTIDWQESAAHGLSRFLQIPMGRAREAVSRMFAVIEDVDYLTLHDDDGRAYHYDDEEAEV